VPDPGKRSAQAAAFRTSTAAVAMSISPIEASTPATAADRSAARAHAIAASRSRR
jgi:hypothetical protein